MWEWVPARMPPVDGQYPACMGRIRMAVLASLLGVLGVVVFGAAAQGGSHEPPIVVIEVGDPIDQLQIDYIVEVLSADSVHLFILKIDSPGVSSGDVVRLYQAVESAGAPVVSWIGPEPAVAYGGAAVLAGIADIRSAAPGARVGYLNPVVQRDPARDFDDVVAASGITVVPDETLFDSTVTLGAEVSEIPGLVDRLDPALGQLILSLDGTSVSRNGVTWQISTASLQTVGEEVFVVATRSVTFTKPQLLNRFLRLGARPETAFLFLLIGAAFAVFEFYAAGRGLMAVVASVSFLIAGYGIATLPMWWPGLAMVLGGLGIVVWGFAQNRVDWRAVLGSGFLVAGGMFFTTSRPAYPPSAVMVVVAVAVSVGFIWYSLTTVVRGRFATPTVGREEILEQRCLVVEALDPEGVVVLDGYRWRATADRGVFIGAGAGCEIVGVTGLVLEVDPLK